MTQPRTRPPRADSVRNRAKILDAARGQITEHGPGVGMDQIATAAGVAVGTLYRHVPTKTDLVAAVVAAFVTQVADRAQVAVDRVEAGHPAFDELAAVLRDVVRAAATNQAVKAAAAALDADAGDPADLQTAHGALKALIDAARADHAVRDDLTLDDVYLLMANTPADQPTAVLDRWVELALHGIAGPSPRVRG